VLLQKIRTALVLCGNQNTYCPSSLWQSKYFSACQMVKNVWPFCASILSVSACIYKEKLYIKLIKITVLHYNMLFKLIILLKVFKNLAMVYHFKNLEFVYHFKNHFFFRGALRPNAGHGLLNLEISRSHSLVAQHSVGLL
jgi:hypothetical protein